MTEAVAPVNRAGRTVSVRFRSRMNEQGDEMLWLASWIVDNHGREGEWFFSGTTSKDEDFVAPPEAIAIRIRRWPSAGIDPEYSDIELDNSEHQVINDRALQFDRKQRWSMLVLE